MTFSSVLADSTECYENPYLEVMHKQVPYLRKHMSDKRKVIRPTPDNFKMEPTFTNLPDEFYQPASEEE